MDYGDNSLLIAMFFIAMRRLRICFLYRLGIQVRLGISGVTTQLYSWRSKSDAGSAERAAQIDMVIERGDNTINLCEMKFSEGEFSINKDYEKILRNKIVRFMEETKTRKSKQLTFISSYGLQRNMYSSIVQNEVVLNDLF